ncbi:MAG: hypothetical protein VKI81_01095 [Synechococcaceae cyanobacterium]|nr:hypothetical protein [Synechococcaceae cyanobacterium]
MSRRSRTLALLVLGGLLLPPAAVIGQPTPPGAAPATTAPAAGAPTDTGASEREILDRIRQLKTSPWRSFGVCRYDWRNWRLGDGGVRVTAVECGEPPQKGSVAVHCDTLRINRRMGEGAWEPWRLPYSVEESKVSGGEDLMVASLCANVRPTSPPPPASAGEKKEPPKPEEKKPEEKKPEAEKKPEGGRGGNPPAPAKPAT